VRSPASRLGDAVGTVEQPATATARYRSALVRDRWKFERKAPHVSVLPIRAGRALVVLVADRHGHEPEDDGTGALVTELLTETGFVVDGTVTVPSDAAVVRNALNTAVIGGVDLVVTIGGTGVSPRDVVPDVTAEVLDRELPGVTEALRWSGMTAGVTEAVVSRGLCGVSGSTLVVNIAGSRAAIRDGLATLAPLAEYLVGELSSLDEM